VKNLWPTVPNQFDFPDFNPAGRWKTTPPLGLLKLSGNLVFFFFLSFNWK
jgi:hypothetical protein